MTPSEFRAIFPAFASTTAFPDESIQYRLTLADAVISPDVWVEPVILEHAKGLYAAHFLALYGSVAVGGDGTGSMAAGSSGVISSKSVDGASVSFDTGAFTFADAGFWNSTPYGRELWNLFTLFGAGARQLV